MPARSLRTSNPSMRRILRSTLAVVDINARSSRLHSFANEIRKYLQVPLTKGSEDIMSAARKDQQLFWLIRCRIERPALTCRNHRIRITVSDEDRTMNQSQLAR